MLSKNIVGIVLNLLFFSFYMKKRTFIVNVGWTPVSINFFSKNLGIFSRMFNCTFVFLCKWFNTYSLSLYPLCPLTSNKCIALMCEQSLFPLFCMKVAYSTCRLTPRSVFQRIFQQKCYNTSRKVIPTFVSRLVSANDI